MTIPHPVPLTLTPTLSLSQKGDGEGENRRSLSPELLMPLAFGRRILLACLLVLADCGGVETATSSGSSVPKPRFGIMPGTMADEDQSVRDRVFFTLDSSELSPEADKILERQALYLKYYPSLRLLIEGHADERGTREYNLALGARRAEAMKRRLVALGVASSRLTSISYGKERPQFTESTEEAWAQNRRAVGVVQN